MSYKLAESCKQAVACLCMRTNYCKGDDVIVNRTYSNDCIYWFGDVILATVCWDKQTVHLPPYPVKVKKLKYVERINHLLSKLFINCEIRIDNFGGLYISNNGTSHTIPCELPFDGLMV